MPDAKPVGPVPPGSTAQEITDLLNHEDPLVPKLVPSPADRKPQESEQQNWGTTGEAKDERPAEPQRLGAAAPAEASDPAGTPLRAHGRGRGGATAAARAVQAEPR